MTASTFIEDGKAVRFEIEKTTWKCDLSSYACVKIPAAARSVEEVEVQPDAEQPVSLVQRRQRQPGPSRSPDGKWTAFVKDNNVFVRAQGDDAEVQLSKDGKEGLAYGMLSWAPDSKTVAAFRIEPGERKEVYLIESSPRAGGRAQLRSRAYPLPGDKFTAFELNLFDVASKKQLKPAVDRIDFGFPTLRWNRDGRHFTYKKTDRGHQRFQLIEIDSHTGHPRDLIDEKTKTFIWTAHTERRGDPLNYLDKTNEIIWASEQDGWRHLYLIDAKAGKVNNQITKGDWVVRGIDRVDEPGRQVWFRASGKNKGQDPYLIHHYRVNFDGTGLVALTEGDGDHTVSYSPDRKFLIDRYSRVDLAAVHELRRVSDGKLVCDLEKANISELKASGWEAPEVFTAKGRDGKTDIWGIITRPRELRPEEEVSRHRVHLRRARMIRMCPRPLPRVRRFSSLTDLGFIVVQIDGMGTANRSKAFHDVCWHNLKDAGFPDRVLWHKAVAKKYPWYDASRVGIHGTSAGGQNAMGALLVPRRLLQGRRRGMRLPRQPHGQGFVERAMDGLSRRPALRGLLQRR